MSRDLVVWLRGVLDKRAQVAREAGGASWAWRQGFGQMCNDPECPYGQLMADNADGLTQLMDVHGYDVHDGWQGAEHIALNDPAQVLRDVEATRRLLDQVKLRGDSNRATIQPSTGGVWDDLLRILALPYAAWPGYRDEWRL